VIRRNGHGCFLLLGRNVFRYEKVFHVGMVIGPHFPYGAVYGLVFIAFPDLDDLLRICAASPFNDAHQPVGTEDAFGNGTRWELIQMGIVGFLPLVLPKIIPGFKKLLTLRRFEIVQVVSYIYQPFCTFHANGMKRIRFVDKDVQDGDIHAQIPAGFEQVAAGRR